MGYNYKWYLISKRGLFKKYHLDPLFKKAGGYTKFHHLFYLARKLTW